MSLHFIRGAACAAALLGLSGSAFPHATLAPRQAQADATYRAVVQINHGCDGAPTTTVRVSVPDGVIGARPMPKPGWNLTTTTGPYLKAYPSFHGRTLSEGVREIAWSGGSLPDDQYDEFIFTARITDDFAPGAVVRFPVVQQCADKELRWVEIPAAGQNEHELKSPAPGVRIAAAETASESHAGSPPAIRAGGLVIEAPWARATPAGAKVAGGYVRVTNAGSEPDRLISASASVAGRGEVHEMSVQNGVMRMREIEGGIEIKPGQTIELKPGGLHIMFMDLRGGLKEGEMVSGSLVFEKAGTVPVTFRVGGLGAQAAPAHSHP